MNVAASIPPWVQFAELLDHLAAALLIVEKGVVVYANAAAVRIVGQEGACQLKGALLEEVSPPERYPHIHQACNTVCSQEVPAVHLGGMMYAHERYRSHVDVHVSRLRIGTRCAVVLLPYDLSQLTDALHRSQEAKKRIADLIGTLPGVVWEYDCRKQTFTLISDYARVLTGCQTGRFLQPLGSFSSRSIPKTCGSFGRYGNSSSKRWNLAAGDSACAMRSIPAAGDGCGRGSCLCSMSRTNSSLREASHCDIYRRVEIQQLLERHGQQLEALIHFSSRFVEVRTEEEILVALRELMRRTLGFDDIAIYLRCQNDIVEKAQVVGDAVVWESMELELMEDITRLRDVLLGRIPYFVSRDALRDVSDIERALWVQLLGRANRVFSNAVVPIRGRTKMLGALAVDRRDTSEPITESELSMLLTIGRYAGLALDNARLMQELRVAEERLHHLVQNLPAAVWELNLATQQMEFVSGYVEQWLGYMPEEWQTRPGLYLSVVHPDDIELFQQVIQPDISSTPQPVEVRLRDKQGRWHWCHVLWTLAHEGGRDPVVRGVTTDITAQKQAEQQQLHLMRLRSLGEIASGVAHNFNNLLMGILGNVELLQSSQQHDPELRRRAEIIAQLAHDASAIVQRMQGFYKPQPPIRRERIGLQTLLEDVIESTRPVWHDLAGRRGAEIQVNLVAEADPVVEANRSELHGAFTNLIINACDAMPRGGTITLSLREQDGRAVIDVAGTGIGLSPVRQLKERAPSIPIILLTGWGDQLREDKPREVDMVLAKPVHRAALRAALNQLVHR